MSNEELPQPLTDLHQLAPTVRSYVNDLLTGLVGPVALEYDFYREWNGCWRVRVDVRGSANGRLDFVLLRTAQGGILALPRPLPERWRTSTGIRATDGSIWTLTDAGDLVPFPTQH